MTFLRSMTVFCVTAVGAMPALAQCPTQDDLTTGIRFHVDEGDTETFRRLPNGVIESDFGTEDSVSRVRLGKGIYLLELFDLEYGDAVPGTRLTFAFPSAIGDLPDPTPGLTWDVTVVVNDQGYFENERQSYVFGAAQPVRFGDCAYEMIPIQLRYPSGDSTDVLHYLPALGLSYLASYSDPDGSESYTYHKIEVVE